MIDRWLASIAPHHCLGCGEIGHILCACCNNNILDESFSSCLICGQPVSGDNLCSRHLVAYQRAWCVSRRDGVILELIDAYKFQRALGAYEPIADLLDSCLPALPDNTLLVPVPTAPSNIRVRGYGHMLLVARELSKRRGWQLSPILERNNNITQHFAKNASERRKQAAGFFKTGLSLDPHNPYLIIDDIFTTGSTVEAAVKCLKAAGASDVWVAVVAKQT